MFHTCFIYSSIDGHLVCFHILVIVKNTAMNIGVLTFFGISVLVFIVYTPRSGITGSKGGSIFNFLPTDHLSAYWSPQWLHQSAFPSTVQKGPPCSTLLPALALCQFMEDSHSVRCEMTSHHSSNLHFSDH